METIVTKKKRGGTISEGMEYAISRGYTENYKLSAIGFTTDTEEKYYSLKVVKIMGYFRFYENPNETTILFLIQTSDGKKGTLIDGMKTTSPPDIPNFLLEVRNAFENI